MKELLKKIRSEIRKIAYPDEEEPFLIVNLKTLEEVLDKIEKEYEK